MTCFLIMTFLEITIAGLPSIRGKSLNGMLDQFSYLYGPKTLRVLEEMGLWSPDLPSHPLWNITFYEDSGSYSKISLRSSCEMFVILIHCNHCTLQRFGGAVSRLR